MVHQNIPSDTVESRNAADIFDDARPGYITRKAIAAVKDAVSIEQVAAEYGNVYRRGANVYETRCIAPDYEDRNPSLKVYAERQRFHCFSCGLHGDLLDFERIAGRHTELWTAIIALSTRYGVALPERPTRRYKRQKPVRDALEQVKIDAVHRRLFRYAVREYIADLEDEDERDAEARAMWEQLGRIARMIVARGGRP